jgi:transcription termination factor Rho
VSVDSIDVDSLERKDRAELAAIATALGGKPTSRTKKADIIGMILELAGVTSATATSGGGDGGAPEGGDRTTDRGGADRGTAAAPEPAGSEAVTGREATPAAGGGEPAGSGPQRDQHGAAGETRNGQEVRRRDEGQARAGQEPGGHPDGRDGGSGGEGPRTQQGQATSGPQQQGEPEPGNRRRRRRRGRDRDRDRQDEAHEAQPWDGEPVEVSGYLDLRDEGYGFLRVKGYLPSREDVYVSVKQTRQLGLRKGDHLEGASRPANRGEKNPALLRIDRVNGMDPEEARKRPRFEDLTPLFPDQRLRLERPDQPLDMTSRIIDLIAPIGKGQRGLIVSPPKAGKTTVMKTIAQSIEHNNPEVHLMVLLVDERPEEVTDMRRSVRGDVIASTFDRPSDEHTQVAELTIERAKRMVEMGRDVVIILDGITRLARAYNLAAPATGRIMSGGIDTGALYPPKKFFGAARNVEEGGSLTILATALVETGSKMDEVIFEEFKGTGNMELRLDRRAAEKRIYPAIDVDASSTRHEELLFERAQLQQVWKLRRVLSGLAADGNPGAGLELLIDRMRTFPNNDMFLAEIAKAPGVPG